MGYIFYEITNNLTYIGVGLAAIIVIIIIASFKKGVDSTLILQEFIFNENEDVFLIIKGRASGFRNWVLSLFNKAPITTFSCSKRLLKYNTYYIPMKKISCVSSAMINKFRIIIFILGIILFIAGIALPPFAENSYRITLVIVGITLFLCSFIKKRTMHIDVYLFENKPFISITLKKGIINSINNEAFKAAANTLNRIVLANAIEK